LVWPDGCMNVRMIRYFVVVFAAPLALAACGGGSGSSKSSASGGSTTTTVKGANAQGAALSDCLKQHGVTLPAGFGNGGPPSGGTPGSLPSGQTPGPLPAGVDTQKLQSALQACGGAGGGFAGGGQNSQAFKAYTSCLSDHGVKVPTQTGSSTPPSFDRNSSAFASANRVCAALLPNTTTTKPN
jgi:hypothetical protein